MICDELRSDVKTYPYITHINNAKTDEDKKAGIREAVKCIRKKGNHKLADTIQRKCNGV